MASILYFLLLLGTFFVFGYGTCPRIISRNGWGVISPRNKPQALPGPVHYVIVHHVGIKTYCMTQKDCTKAVISYQNNDMNVKNLNDIGYNFLVGEDGNAYEGCGWNVVAAHALAYNNKSLGIAFIGNFTDRLPNRIALTVFRQLIECGVKNNKLEKDYKLMAHRDITFTDCPGKMLYTLIKSREDWTDEYIMGPH